MSCGGVFGIGTSASLFLWGEACGALGVPDDDGRDRLILGPAVVNSCFQSMSTSCQRLGLA
eukprot:7162377-Pyramimonas_sp.AAC.1